MRRGIEDPPRGGGVFCPRVCETCGLEGNLASTLKTKAKLSCTIPNRTLAKCMDACTSPKAS